MIWKADTIEQGAEFKNMEYGMRNKLLKTDTVE